MATGYEKLIQMALNQDDEDQGRVPASLVAMPQLAPVAKGSGLGQKMTQQGTEKQNVTETKNIMLTPEEIQNAYQSAVNTDAVKAQMAGADTLSKLAETEASQPVQTDYSSLAHLADLWSKSGGQLASGYKAPENPAAARIRAEALTEKAQDDRRDITKSIMDFIQKQKAGTQMSQYLSEIKSAMENSAKDPTMQEKHRDPSLLARDVMTSADKAVKPLSDISVSYTSIQNALENPTVESLGRLKSLLARVMASEKGNLAEGDVGRAFPPTLEEKFARAVTLLTSNPNKSLPDDLVKGLRVEVEKAKSSANQLAGAHLNQVRESFGASPGYQDLPLDKILKPYSGYTAKITAPKHYYDPSKDVPKTPEEKQKRLEYLKSKAGK